VERRGDEDEDAVLAAVGVVVMVVVGWPGSRLIAWYSACTLHLHITSILSVFEHYVLRHRCAHSMY